MNKKENILCSSVDESVKLFNNVTIKNSEIKKQAIIGDDAIIIDSVIGNNTSINRTNSVLKSSIGQYTYTAERNKFLNADVGQFCSIAWQVSIGAGKHDYSKVTTHPLWRFKMLDGGLLEHEKNIDLKTRYKTLTRCVIGNDVWIAPNTIIVTDIKIGNGAVIGAGAVVTKDVEPYTIVAGVPAKPIRKRFPDKIIEALEEIQWWNWPIEIIKENLDLIYSTKVDDSVIERMRSIAKTI